jgi:hypothetical protein
MMCRPEAGGMGRDAPSTVSTSAAEAKNSEKACSTCDRTVAGAGRGSKSSPGGGSPKERHETEPAHLFHASPPEEILERGIARPLVGNPCGYCGHEFLNDDRSGRAQMKAQKR